MTYATETGASESGLNPEGDSKGVNCGVSCVYLALGMSGVQCSLAELETRFDLEKGFTDLLQCSNVLNRYGLETKSIRLRNPSDILSLPTLAILAVRKPHDATEENHFVLYNRANIAEREICICDSLRSICIPYETLAHQWSGICLLVSPDKHIIDSWISDLSGNRRKIFLASLILSMGCVIGVVMWYRKYLQVRRSMPSR
jgi:ABC-type bacteriocin/lantibiotic exporter with double-glycine peptidase domain